MNQLPSKEVEQATGLTRQTIQGYVKAGWLPSPEFKSFGRYGGSNFWPETTIKQLLTIKSLKQAGCKNTDIDEILKGVKNV